jgi:hypothetical protein
VRRVRACHPARPLVAEDVHVRAAGEPVQRRGTSARDGDPHGVLGRVRPTGRGHRLEDRIAMAEGRLAVRDVGDRAAVGLERDGGQVCASAVCGAAQQEGLDRLVGEGAEVVALPGPAQRVPLDAVLPPLQLQVRQRPDPLGDGTAYDPELIRFQIL